MDGLGSMMIFITLPNRHNNVRDEILHRFFSKKVLGQVKARQGHTVMNIIVKIEMS